MGGCDCDFGGGDAEVKEPPSPVPASPVPARREPKAVDEDLYKISPDLLYARTKRVSLLHSLLSFLDFPRPADVLFVCNSC